MSKYNQKIAVRTILIALIMALLFSILSSKFGQANFSDCIGTSKSLENWSEDVRLTFASYKDEYIWNKTAMPQIAIGGSTAIHIVYRNESINYTEIGPSVWSWVVRLGDIEYLRSDDSGRTFSKPEKLTHDEYDSDPVSCYNASSFPDIVSCDNNIYVVWQKVMSTDNYEIYFKKSSDNGQTWDNDTALTSNDGKASQWPKIAVNESCIHVVWSDFRNLDPNGFLQIDAYYRKGVLEENGSITWQDEKRLTNNTLCDESPHGIFIINNTIHIILTEYVGYWRVGYMKSENGGESWSEIKVLNDVAHSYAVDIVGNSSVVYALMEETKLYAGNESAARLFYFQSNDGGNSWKPKKQLTYNLMPYQYYPQQIIMDPKDNDKLYITAHLHSDPNYGGTGERWAQYFVSINGGTTWQGPYNLSDNQTYSPQLAVSDGYVHAVFTSDRTGNSEIYYKRSPPFGTEPANITITAEPNTLTADGISNSTLTIRIYNDTCAPLPNQTVTLAVSGSGTVGNVTDNGDGSYIANYTAGTVTGNVIITATAGFVSNNTTIILKAGVITRIEIEPGGPKWYAKGENCTYTAGGYDSFHNVNTSWQPYWHVDGGVGIINDTGFFMATKKGIGAVNCTDNVTGIYNVSIVVVNNSRPIIEWWSPTEKSVSINEIENITFSITASDPDNDNLSYSWYINETILPAENNSSYTFSSNYNSSGAYNITVSVSDGNLSGNFSWFLNVFNVNRAPTLECIEKQTAYEGQEFTLQIVATDLDNDILTFSDNSTLFDINATTGLISFVPNYDSAGIYRVNITVTDGEDTVWQTFQLEIINVNRKPIAVISLPSSGTKFTTSDNINFDAEGSCDPDNESLNYTWSSNIDGIIGYAKAFSTKLSAGTHTITLTVTDGSLSDAKQITITIEKPPERGWRFISTDGLVIIGTVCAVILIIVVLRKLKAV